MGIQIHLDPLLPWVPIAAMAAIAAAILARRLLAGQMGAFLRLAILLTLVGALLNPSIRRELREYDTDIVILLDDRSASQEIGGRVAETDATLAELRDRLGQFDGIEIAASTLRNGQDGSAGKSLLLGKLKRTVAGLDEGRIAGAVLVTDGQVHDSSSGLDFPFPVHALVTGRRDEFDRRIEFRNYPAYSVVGETATMSVSVLDEGIIPDGGRPRVISVSTNGEPPVTHVTDGDREITIDQIRRGRNLVVVSTPPVPGELTTFNNMASVEINGVRDRLRVLLVSGFPHPGQRTWRNILKSDESIELIHFNILRTGSDARVGAPEELSLIPFPVHELFAEKIDTFDLVIFDRYVLYGFLSAVHFHFIRNQVADGGALLVAAGPEFASEASIHSSVLAEILPAAPTGAVIEGGFVPTLTEIGKRHPVTSALADSGWASKGNAGDAGWGRWFRQVGLARRSGLSLMEGNPGAGPLLLLDRVGEGRVALLGSDQVWLWHREVEGGGPQTELLRRLVHWLMKEPELEEEALTAKSGRDGLVIEHRSVDDRIPTIAITGPEGQLLEHDQTLLAPGRHETVIHAAPPGLYQVSDGSRSLVTVVGPEFPGEFEAITSTARNLADAASGSGGGVWRIEDGIPELRLVEQGRKTSGENWLGLVPRESYRVLAIESASLLPGALGMLLVLILAAIAWTRDGEAPGQGQLRPFRGWPGR